MMNNKYAAGIGRSLEVIAGMLDVDINGMEALCACSTFPFRRAAIIAKKHVAVQTN